MTRKSLTSILLAAGTSNRFGSTNKLLTPVDGVPLCAHALRSLISSSTDNILVVTGYEHELVTSTQIQYCGLSTTDQRIQFVHNPQFNTGMGTSIAMGVKHAADTSAVLVCLADMPGITKEVINALHSEWLNKPQFFAYVPQHNGRIGNPVLLTRDVFPKLVTLNADKGARDILKEHKNNVLKVAMATDSIFKDVDVQSDLL